MKAKIDMNNGNPVLTLLPESKEDEKTVASFEKQLRQQHAVQTRGIDYLDPETSFYFWVPRDDR